MNINMNKQNKSRGNTLCTGRPRYKPFLKWIGGKTQIIGDIMKKIPTEINNYHELFLGGGSVLFAILSLQKQNKITINGKIYAYDINEQLINVYKHVQNNKDALFHYISYYIHEYDNIKGTVINRKPLTIEEAKTSKESYYYWIREKFNKYKKNKFCENLDNSIEYSALFMFLNKTCFRGMYREGPNGYNVPYGHYKKTPTIITKDDLDNISELIKDVEFICADFNTSMKNTKFKIDDFIYFDPPYAPIKSTSFVKYNIDGFDLETHKKLFNAILKLNKKKIKFLMSNAKVELVLEYFDQQKFNYEEIIARRAINSKNPESTVIEVLINNL